MEAKRAKPRIVENAGTDMQAGPRHPFADSEFRRILAHAIADTRSGANPSQINLKAIEEMVQNRRGARQATSQRPQRADPREEEWQKLTEEFVRETKKRNLR